MLQGLYAAANGMIAVEDRQAVIANNIANATTPGFRRQIAVQKGFYLTFLGELNGPQRLDMEAAPGGGVKTIETFTQHTGGILRHTGNALDVALMGPGFIRVETPNGERFTRNGQFSVGPGEVLVTGDGYRVMSAGGGPIDLSGGAPIFHGDGTVTVNGETRGQLSIAEFDDPHVLVQEGYSLYRIADGAGAQPQEASATTVVGQSIETSNVQIPAEIVQMMVALRAYAANQKVISSVDETVSRLIDQVGTP